jgi:hypothetical protein
VAGVAIVGFAASRAVRGTPVVRLGSVRRQLWKYPRSGVREPNRPLSVGGIIA